VRLRLDAEALQLADQFIAARLERVVALTKVALCRRFAVVVAGGRRGITD
jgi:hypothetical protein